MDPTPSGRASRGVASVVRLLMLTSLGVAPLAAQTPSPFAGDPTAGRSLFLQRGCLHCHSIWGSGGTLGPDLAIVGAGRSMQQLAGMFWNHTPRMIETVRRRGVKWPTFTEEELANLISYVYYVKLFDEPGDPALGARWFREKRCVECHSVGGKGEKVGPALDQYANYIAPIMLAEGMWNHGPRMQYKQVSRGVAIPTFAGREMADIQAYIRQTSSLRGRKVRFLLPPQPAKGQQLFGAKKCVRCHGPEGRGTSYGPDLRTATLPLRVSEIAGVLWNHSFQMSSAMQARGFSFPRFEGAEMADVIAFLYYVRFNETGGNSIVGATLFESKGCTQCHSRGGEKSIGPDLSHSKAPPTSLGLATAMWNHGPAMYDRATTRKIEWPGFEKDEMRDLAEYLRDLATRAPARKAIPPVTSPPARLP